MGIFNYRWSAGSAAWIFHRISGIFLSMYLLVHVYILLSLGDAERFKSIILAMENPAVKVLDTLLLAMVLIHALNGVRITLFEFGMPTRYQRPAFEFVSTIFVFIMFFVVLFVMGGTS